MYVYHLLLVKLGIIFAFANKEEEIIVSILLLVVIALTLSEQRAFFKENIINVECIIQKKATINFFLILTNNFRYYLIYIVSCIYILLSSESLNYATYKCIIKCVYH